MKIKPPKEYTEEDVVTDRVDHLIEHRVPWIIIGIFGGLVATFIISKFEAILSTDVRLVFFIPIIVYLSGAVGMQTETIYVRELSERRINFLKYIFKESIIGFSLGITSGVFLGIFIAYWLKSSAIGFTIGLTMLVNLTLAPVLAVCISSILYKEHSDPALGAGPMATIIQDLISLLVYFSIASVIIF